MNLEEDIKRCEQLIESKNSSWLGISNQRAIAHLIEKIKELEAKLEFKQYGDLDNLKFEEYMNEFIPKEKIRDRIKELKIIQEENADEIKRNIRFYSIYDSYELQINELQELLQEENK